VIPVPGEVVGWHKVRMKLGPVVVVVQSALVVVAYAPLSAELRGVAFPGSVNKPVAQA
jgi:hypothetical protein